VNSNCNDSSHVSHLTSHVSRILVDADSFPFKDLLIDIVKDFSVKIIMVTSVSHYYREERSNVELVIVDNISQAADIKIFNLVSADDLVVTGDFGLAGLVLSKGAFVVTPRGKIINKSNIDYLLEKRNVEARIRRGGGRTTGPRKLTCNDKENFCSVIMNFLSKK